MKACCYTRTSTLDQAKDEKASIPEQIRWARQYAQEKGWEFTDEYIEPGIKGDVEFEEREAANQLLQEARPLHHPERKFDVVLVYHSSRLAREADLVLKFHRILAQQYKIQVYMRNAPVETGEPENYYWGGNYIQQITATLAGVQDQQENVARGERVRTGFQGLAKQGKLVFAPYGYRKVKELTPEGKYSWHFETDPEQSTVVQEIFDLYANQGLGLRSIMEKLKSRAIPSPAGKNGTESWTAASIKNILNNPTYIGLVRWGRKLGSKKIQRRSQCHRQAKKEYHSSR